MGQPYKPFWQVEHNDAHDIPEGATFYIEGYRRRLRFEVKRGPDGTRIEAVESRLSRKALPPVFYWRVGKGVRHEMPDLAVVRFKIDPCMKCELMLTGPFAIVEFFRGKSGGDRMVTSITSRGIMHFGVVPSKSKQKAVSMPPAVKARSWCLDDPGLDFIEHEVKKGKTWKVEG
jgi:hypothetical protein